MPSDINRVSYHTRLPFSFVFVHRCSAVVLQAAEVRDEERKIKAAEEAAKAVAKARAERVRRRHHAFAPLRHLTKQTPPIYLKRDIRVNGTNIQGGIRTLKTSRFKNFLWILPGIYVGSILQKSQIRPNIEIRPLNALSTGNPSLGTNYFWNQYRVQGVFFFGLRGLSGLSRGGLKLGIPLYTGFMR